MILCTCCQAELTAPQFYNGNPYGWTCIRRVDPSYKRNKKVYVKCDSFKVLSDGNGTGRYDIVFVVDGVKTRHVFYKQEDSDFFGWAYMKDGDFYVKMEK